MDFLECNVPQAVYLSALKSRCGNPFRIFSERVTGIVLGNFFSVAYYCPYEWNRQITGECNRAMGYTKEVEGKTQVLFFRTAGLLSPSWVLFFFLLCCGVASVIYGLSTGIVAGSIMAIGLLLFSGWCSSVTEEGEQGAQVISMLLEDPEKFYYCK